MSVESALELHASSSPRSLLVFLAAETQAGSSGGRNPFDSAAASADGKNVMAVVYGTERGSLHYRTFSAPGRTSSRVDGNSSQLGMSTPSSSPPAHQVLNPLGVGSSNQRASNLPRTYYPADLGSLSGPVVCCVKLGVSSSNTTYFLLLVDDNRGTSVAQPGAYAAVIVSFTVNNMHVIIPSGSLPRMSCATFHPLVGLVYGAGRSILTLAPETWEEEVKRGARYANNRAKRFHFGQNNLPAPGIRAGQDALEITADGKVAIAIVGNTFHAVAGQDIVDGAQGNGVQGPEDVKILSFSQSSQVHPVIALDLKDESMDDGWYSLFLASGRECAVVDIFYGPPSAPSVTASKPRNGSVTLASPILAAASSWPWVAVLTSDGLVSIRSPSCLSITLRTVEVGQRPNDFFVLRSQKYGSQQAPWIVALAYSGECKVLQCQADSAQDLADRTMRHAIDAFGANGFPRAEVATAVGASLTAASYVGPEPSQHARILLRQYLEALLGLADFEGNPGSGWFADLQNSADLLRLKVTRKPGNGSDRISQSAMLTERTPNHLMTVSALLCLVCGQLSPPNYSLANRAAKRCAEAIGVVFYGRDDVDHSSARVCELVADKILREAANNFSLLSSPTSSSSLQPIRASYSSNHSAFIEAAIWLLRSAGKHEQAIDVAYSRLLQQGLQSEGEAYSAGGRGTWSRIKYESYTATHLSEIWCTGKDEGKRLVLKSPATFRLLENNPRLGLSVFTASHPHHEEQWRTMEAKDDPLAHSKYIYDVLSLLKSVNPALPYDRERSSGNHDSTLPLESGRALAVSFLESAIGVSTGRPTEGIDSETLAADEKPEHVSNFHDEFSFLLLEGVIAEQHDNGISNGNNSHLGEVYRKKLRNFLKWPLARLRPDKFMSTLPPSFLQEKALILGRVGRHEDALRILYHDLESLTLALEYCDDRHEQQKNLKNRRRQQVPRSVGMDQSVDLSFGMNEDNAYLPLVRVALDSKDKERGVTAAIQVLALRRSAVDRAAAVRLLPSGVPVSAVARPFLIPALVDSESQERRLTIVSALMRAKYLRLKESLTMAQLRAQSSINVVAQFRSIKMGELLHSTKPAKARTSATASSTMPDVMIVKHFFPRHLVIQAKVTNVTGGPTDYALSTSGKIGRTLTDVAFVVAESSEEAIQSLLQIPIKVLPPKLSGSAWCVLEAAPGRIDGAVAQLTSELRYTLQSVEAPALVGNPDFPGGRTYVEELQDLEVHTASFT